MKNYFFLVLSILVFNSCSSVKPKSIEGEWLNSKNEMYIVAINKFDGDYWIEFYGEKYKLQATKFGYKFLKENKTFQIAYNEKTNILTLNKNKFIRETESKKYYFVGTWHVESEGPIKKIEITDVNGGIVWNVYQENNSAKYYPKLTKTGYTFTYNNDQLYFEKKDDYIVDSQGRKYLKK